MKFILICMLALSLSLGSCLSDDEEQKEKLPFEVIDQLGTSQMDNGKRVVLDGQGNLYMAGEANGDLPGVEEGGYVGAFLAKYDSAGSRLWVRQFGYDPFAGVKGIGTDVQGNVYVSGHLRTSFDGHREGFVTKYAPDGEQRWMNSLGCFDEYGVQLTYVYGMAVNASGDSYLTGQTECALKEGVGDRSIHDVFLVKYNSRGEKLWLEHLGIGTGKDVALDSENNVYLLSDGLDDITHDAVLMKYSPDGQQLWLRSFEVGSISDIPESVIADASDNVYVAGRTYGDKYIFLAKYSSSGDLQWIREFQETRRNFVVDMDIDSQGDIYIAGYNDKELANVGRRIFLLKYNGEGELQWHRYPVTGDHKVQGIAVAPGGEAYMTGYTYEGFPGFQIQGYNDIFLIKYPGETLY